MFGEHNFRVHGANQVRYLSARPGSIGTPQIKDAHCSLILTWYIVEIFMFGAHNFHVDDANQVRYLGAMPVSIGTTQNQNKVGHFYTMV